MSLEVDKNHPTKNYSIFAKALHWGFAAVFIYGIIKQVDNISQLEDAALLRFEGLFASAFLLLLIARFVYMKATQTSSLPEETSHAKKLAAKIVHYGMYLSLAMIAISGLVIGLLYKSGVKSGNLIDFAIALHEFSILSSYWLIGAHVLAAIYHRFLKDGVWSSMVPFLKE